MLEDLKANQFLKDGTPHRHVYLQLSSKVNLNAPTCLDLKKNDNVYHGNYQGCRSAANVKQVNFRTMLLFFKREQADGPANQASCSAQAREKHFSSPIFPANWNVIWSLVNTGPFFDFSI